MAKAVMRVLTSDEEEFIHRRTLQVLEEIGVLVRSDSVLSALEDAGALVDERSHVAKMPEEMVKGALRSAPTSFRLCARRRDNDIDLPASRGPHLTTDGLTLYVHDDDTGENRNATKEDFANFARLADALEPVDFFWPIVTISDVPSGSHNLHELWTALKNCGMHVQGDCTSAGDAKKMIELGAIIAEGREELRNRPLFSCATNPISPLSFDKGAVEAQAEFAKAGIPVLCHSMSIAGMSSPVTLAGTIVNINAENLASNVISQESMQGAPFIYSSESAPMDMMTGVMDYNAYQLPLIAAGAAQMAKRYGFPAHTASWGFETIEPGIQGSLSEAFGVMLNTFSGSDEMSGAGSLDHAKGAALEQVVLDSYIWSDIRTYMHKFPFSKDTIALDVVEAVGHAGTFLKHPHTLKNFRTEIFARDKTRKHWQATESIAMMDEVREIARKTLKEHRVAPLPVETVRKGSQLVKEYERKPKG